MGWRYANLSKGLSVNELKCHSFTFLHDSSHKKDDTIKISDHLHPDMQIRRKGKQNIKLVSYIIIRELIILPTFSPLMDLNTCLNFTENVYLAFSNPLFYWFY